jgi:hypothetical protein
MCSELGKILQKKGKTFLKNKMPTTNFPNFGGKILDLHLEQGIFIVHAILYV